MNTTPSRIQSVLLTLIASAVISFVPTLALAQEAAVRVVAEPSSLDFGDLQPGETASRTVTITNVGNFTIHIRSTRASCECTAPSLRHTQIDPKQSVEMTVKFDASKRYGPQTPYVTLVFSERIPPLRIEGRANVNHGIRFELSPAIVDPPVATLESAGELPFKVLAINGNPIDSPNAGMRHELTLTRAPSSASFPGAERWVAIATDDPNAPVVVVPTNARPRPLSPGSWTIIQPLRVLGSIKSHESTTIDVELNGIRAETLDAIEGLDVTTHNASAGLIGLELTATGILARFYLRPETDEARIVAATIDITADGHTRILDIYAGVTRPDDDS